MERPLDAESIAKAYRLEFIPCALYHPHSCEVNAFKRFLQIFRLALKVYLPVHTLPVLLFHLKALRKDPLRMLLKVIINICRSCGFLATYGFIMRYILCRMGTYCGYGRLTWVTSVFVGGISLAIEVKNRRAELAMYILPRTLEATWNMLAARGLVKSPPLGEWMLFAFGMSALMHYYQTDPELIKPTYRSIFKFIFGEN